MTLADNTFLLFSNNSRKVVYFKGTKGLNSTYQCLNEMGLTTNFDNTNNMKFSINKCIDNHFPLLINDCIHYLNYNTLCMQSIQTYICLNCKQLRYYMLGIRCI